MKRLKQVTRNILLVFLIKVFTVILVLGFAVLAALWLTGCTPAEEIPATATEKSPDIDPADEVVGGDMDIHGCIATAGYQWCDSLEVCYRDWETDCPPMSAVPTLVPTMTPWAFSTPSWEVDNNWPYGITAMAIPIESTFDGSVKVYVLLGSDWMEHREHQDATDAIMLVLVDNESDAATIISVPRDLYIYIPGFGMGRINVAWSLGGFETVRETIRYNFGLNIEGIVYARIYAMERFINQGLGGITVSVREPIYEECGDVIINLSTGSAFMDGEYALCYARARMLTSDYSRMSRQQELLLAMKKRFLVRAANDPVGLAEEIYASYVDAGVQTDISILDLPGLVWMAVETQDTRYYQIVPPLVEHFDHPETGAWLLLMPTPDVIYDYLNTTLEQ
jgi:LCP family protein required for cell wall assembly